VAAQPLHLQRAVHVVQHLTGDLVGAFDADLLFPPGQKLHAAAVEPGDGRIAGFALTVQRHANFAHRRHGDTRHRRRVVAGQRLADGGSDTGPQACRVELAAALTRILDDRRHLPEGNTVP